jgi:tetratricopeptide (TPR) repeat protein
MSVHRSRNCKLPGPFLLGTLLWALGLGFTTQRLIAQSPPPTTRFLDSARVLIAKASPAADLAGIRAAEALLERVLTASPRDQWALHYLGLALYREAGIGMGMGSKDIGVVLERADSLLDLSARLHQIPESYALRAGVLGMMIGLSPLKGITLGPQSGAQMERALELAPNNPRVWLLRGIGAYNTPAMFGGGYDKAEEYLKKAIELFPKDRPAVPAPSWGHNEAYAWLGQTYAKQERPDRARAAYQRALELEPNDGWVRMYLLPALDKKK